MKTMWWWDKEGHGICVNVPEDGIVRVSEEALNDLLAKAGFQLESEED